MIIPIVARGFYSSAPAARTSVQDNPTLLVSWWCTGFALAIIIVRLAGRYVRTETLFREDKVMALSIIPLLIRMALVHVILRWGTNNAVTTGMTDLEIRHREIGSRLVLLSRIMYAAFLWIAKFTISEFLKRLYSGVWKKSYELGLQFIRWFLIITFVGVVIATLSECSPFHRYWQVTPDPGPHCRQGYAQLITMGATDSITDLVLVAFPIPIVLASSMPVKRKVSLVLLFGLSLILVGITIYRVTGTIERHSNQQFRSLLASLEILAAAAVANALVLGSFVRDRGTKKQRFKFGSSSGNSSLDRPSLVKQRSKAVMSWGSDVDLVGDLGMRLGPEFSSPKSTIARPAPIALPTADQANNMTPAARSWNFPRRSSPATDETDLKVHEIERDQPVSPGEIAMVTPRRVSFFDVGGLLGNEEAMRLPPKPNSASRPLSSDASSAFQHASQDFASPQQSRRGSHALLQDIGGLLNDGYHPSSSASPISSPPRARNFPPPSISASPMTPNFSNYSMTHRRGSMAAVVTAPTPAAEQRSTPPQSQQDHKHEHDIPPLQDISGLLR